MKFVVSSTDLLGHLVAVGRVINSKNNVQILDNYLFDLEGNVLTITASDLETTLITKIFLENAEGEGKIAVPAKILNDTLKEFPEQPLTFEINSESMGVDILSENGKFSIVGQYGDDYPKPFEFEKDNTNKITISPSIVLNGINRTVFATAEDELRPVMNGIFVEFTPDHSTFVASDSHKLVRYRRKDVHAETTCSFILPKKPAGLLKNLLSKEINDVLISFDDKNAVFEISNYKMICRLVEGKYPNYESVIPANNENRLIVDRVEYYNSIKRVSVFSNQASNLIKFKLSGSQMVVSAQDLDFSISAYERLNCQYEGEEMEIGFKSVFLLEIISNIPSTDVLVTMSDPSRATLLSPLTSDNEDEDILMLIMPMMVNG